MRVHLCIRLVICNAYDHLVFGKSKNKFSTAFPSFILWILGEIMLCEMLVWKLGQRSVKYRKRGEKKTQLNMHN